MDARFQILQVVSQATFAEQFEYLLSCFASAAEETGATAPASTAPHTQDVRPPIALTHVCAATQCALETVATVTSVCHAQLEFSSGEGVEYDAGLILQVCEVICQLLVPLFIDMCKRSLPIVAAGLTSGEEMPESGQDPRQHPSQHRGEPAAATVVSPLMTVIVTAISLLGQLILLPSEADLQQFVRSNLNNPDVQLRYGLSGGLLSLGSGSSSRNGPASPSFGLGLGPSSTALGGSMGGLGSFSGFESFGRLGSRGGIAVYGVSVSDRWYDR